MTRFNYLITFLERETVLRVLYENLKDKSKINVKKRITSLDHNENEVVVICEDGTAVSGDIVIGCDGVHSKVRHELWRIAQLQEPAAIDAKDKEVMSAEYNCLYGISKGTKGIEDGEMHVNYTEGFSTMIIGGKDKVFWFLFKKLDKIW
jgi:flavin-dependent dehydrogenase